ncbi:HAMP domain-containing protein [Lampropedia puyangensis]|uniref:histidine kinase n=1 Tax=Lampropedia puyangensis TaxID=1330072 RepID=A0A4S8FG58_9BURK|nr:ATP-binding protein [Lampropedia puyangensis]THU05464.1 HAMP domain-containing protein [Lampropedia puyangensis]
MTAIQQAISKAKQHLARLWPDSIFGRMVLILVAGMLAAQFLTSSIWLNVRHAQRLEAPTRLVGERIADLVELLDSGHPRAEVLELATHIGLNATLSTSSQPSQLGRTQHALSAAKLLERVFHERVPDQRQLELLHLALLDDQGHNADWFTLSGFSPLTVVYSMQLQYAPNQWLRITSQLQPGWQEDNAWRVLGDLFWRVYAIRILIVVALVVLAVRWVAEPLSRLAKAAQSLGSNITQATPLDENGPAEVRHAAHAFNRMQARIIAQIEERDRFLAAVSHDLRTPMTRMRLRLALLNTDNHAASVSKLRDDLSDMESLVESTLAFIQAEQRASHVQRLDLDSLAHSLCQDLQELGHHITITGATGAPIEADAMGLKRALSNLLDNALRYGHNVQVLLAHTQETVSITILNEGPCIPEALLASITQPFVRGEPSRNNATGGYGLGLSIVEAVARSHRGQFRLSNRAEQQGVCAYLELPRFSGKVLTALH